MSAGGQEPRGPDRHEPLPGVLGLPGYLYRRMSRRVRLGAAVALTAVLVLAAVAVPLVLDAKREGEARERREEKQRLAEQRRELIARQRPHYGRSAAPGRAATLRALDAAIVADVARRVRSGEVDTPAMRSDCEAAREQPRDGKTQLFCTAVTSDIEAGKFSSAASVGYLYRALADPRTGKFALCKVVGQAGEGSYTRRPPPGVSSACGG